MATSTSPFCMEIFTVIGNAREGLSTRNMDASTLQSTNWSGSIPIVLSLAPTSLSSPTMPNSIHVLVSRQSFLHVGLQSAVLRLHKFAPVSFPNIIRRDEPEADSEATKKQQQQSSSSTSLPTSSDAQNEATTTYPVCWFEDEETQFALRWHLFVGLLWDLKAKPKCVPWKIRLHFTQYPSSQILPLDTNTNVLQTVSRTFMNSLKQALFLQHASSKVAMNMTKQTHERLWDAILRGNYQLYQQVNDDLQSIENLLPVRLMVDSKPPIQRPMPRQDKQTSIVATLGSVLLDWVPDCFEEDENGSVQPALPEVSWSVGGICVPLSANIVDLWKSLSCPDHFLYIVLLTR